MKYLFAFDLFFGLSHSSIIFSQWLVLYVDNLINLKIFVSFFP